MLTKITSNQYVNTKNIIGQRMPNRHYHHHFKNYYKITSMRIAKMIIPIVTQRYNCLNSKVFHENVSLEMIIMTYTKVLLIQMKVQLKISNKKS